MRKLVCYTDRQMGIRRRRYLRYQRIAHLMRPLWQIKKQTLVQTAANGWNEPIVTRMPQDE